MGSLPYVSHPRDDTKGACPLWIPPHDLPMSCLTVSTPGAQGGNLFGEGAESPKTPGA